MGIYIFQLWMLLLLCFVFIFGNILINNILWQIYYFSQILNVTESIANDMQWSPNNFRFIDCYFHFDVQQYWNICSQVLQVFTEQVTRK
jgi:hypothetical protein